jgi:hypothetical protein
MQVRVVKRSDPTPEVPNFVRVEGNFNPGGMPLGEQVFLYYSFTVGDSPLLFLYY